MKKVLYILFHRSVLVALSLLAQVVTLVVMVNIFSEYINSFYWCCIAISVIAALLILGSRIEPAYKIAWLLLILPFPVFGGIFYLLVGGGHIPKRISRRMRRVSEQSEENLREDFKADDLLPLGEDAAGQARYLERFAHCPAYTNTETEYFALGDLVFPRMLEELRKARGMTQEELAEALEVSRQTVGSLENGRYNPSILLAFRIARLFETTIEEVFLYEEQGAE